MNKKNNKNLKNKKKNKSSVISKIIAVLIILSVIIIIVVKNSNKETDENYETPTTIITNYERVYDNCDYGYANIIYPNNKDLDYKLVDEVSGKSWSKTYKYNDYKIQVSGVKPNVVMNLKLFKNEKEVYSNNNVYPDFTSLYCVNDIEGNIVYFPDKVTRTYPIVYNNSLFFLEITDDRFSVKYDNGITSGYYYAVKYIDLSDNKYKEHIFYQYPGF